MLFFSSLQVNSITFSFRMKVETFIKLFFYAYVYSIETKSQKEKYSRF